MKYRLIALAGVLAALFQTAGAPPSRGSAIRAIIGWVRNSRKEPVRTVSRKSGLANRSLVETAGSSAGAKVTFEAALPPPARGR